MAASFSMTLPLQAAAAAVMMGSPTLKVFETHDAVGDPIVTLHQCKHVDRTTKRMQCPAALHLRAHKRGYLAVACDAGHQWVWCAHCCDCSLGTRGCIMPAHWMERDSYDTGKRNHMQRHLAGEGASSPGAGPIAGAGAGRSMRTLDANGRPMGVKVKVRDVPFPQKKIMLTPGLGISVHPYLAGLNGAPMGVDAVSQLVVSGAGAMCGIAGVAGAHPLAQVAGVPVGVGQHNLNSSMYVSPKATMLYLSPVGTSAASRTLWTDGSLALFSQGLQILQRCKHVDRKRNRMPCPCYLRTRNHKRGYLAIVCEAGHQWVWCSYCCDCARPQVGCCNPNHWMERDSFDTGRRNHMQRHLENYDANDDEDGQLMALMAPRQVAMPKLVIQLQPGASQAAAASGASDSRANTGGDAQAEEEEEGDEHEEDYQEEDEDEDEDEAAESGGEESGSGGEGEGGSRGSGAEEEDTGSGRKGGKAEKGSGSKRKCDQHPLFNDELAELAATALMALAQNKRPR